MNRILFVACLTLLLTACIGVESPDSNADAENALRTVTVSGHGEVQVAPDQAMLSFAIQARGKDLTALQNKANKIMADFLALTKKLNIAQVQTSQLSVRPLSHWEDGRTINDGYELERSIRVTLKELDKLGRLIEQSLALGINRISPPDLQSSQAEALTQKALAAAAANAHAKAATLARTLGARLGAIRHINRPFYDGPRPGIQVSGAAVQLKSRPSATYQTGMITFSADIQATFDLAAK